VGETGVFCLPNKNEKGIERCPKNDVTIKNLWYIAKSWEKKKKPWGQVQVVENDSRTRR
jgi:hypothetical protein